MFIALSHAPGELAGLMTAGPHTFERVGRAGRRTKYLCGCHCQLAAFRRKRWCAAVGLFWISANPLSGAQRAALLAGGGKLGFAPEQVRILEEDYLLKPGRGSRGGGHHRGGASAVDVEDGPEKRARLAIVQKRAQRLLGLRSTASAVLKALCGVRMTSGRWCNRSNA